MKYLALVLLFCSFVKASDESKIPYGEVRLMPNEPSDVRLHPEIDSLDSAFIRLDQKAAIELVFWRMSSIDPVKSKYLREIYDRLWTTRKELSGISISPRPHHQGGAIEKAYKFSSGGLIISKDVFDKLMGFEKAYLMLQASLMLDFFEGEHGRLSEVTFDPRCAQAYFGKFHWPISYFFKNYVSSLDRYHTTLTEFQIGDIYLLIFGSEPSATFHHGGTNLWKFNLARRKLFKTKEGKEVLIDRTQEVELNTDGTIVYKEN